jgi:ribonuclease BN (tRNA processing enzyme)
LDGIFFSHLHPDHCLDLCGLYVLRKYHPAGPLTRIPVWGPAGVAARMAQAYDLAGPGMSAEFDFREHDGEVVVGPFRVVPVPVVHPVPAVGFRVSAAGRTLAYTGDTGMCTALDELAADVDVLLAEASFRHGDDNPEGLHLTGRQAGEVAARNGVPRMVITHVPPWYRIGDMMSEAAEAYDGHLNAAAPGATYRV